MTGLLVSVRNGVEARMALAAGVDLIDVKEPLRGALGAADPSTIATVCSEVDGQVPVSAALGELLDFETASSPAIAAVDFAKLGLSGCQTVDDWASRWQEALAVLPAEIRPVAVAYADHVESAAPPPDEVLNVGAELGCRALLVDTWQKSGRNLLDCLDTTSLEQLLARARQDGLITVLGGALTLAILPNVLELKPDFVAIRGAACGAARSSALSDVRLQELVNQVASCRTVKRSAVASAPRTRR